MPIKIESVTDDLYLLHWVGDVKMPEIRESHEATQQMATKAGVDGYIHILDMSSMKSFPLDLNGLLKVLFGYPKAFAVFVVKGSILTRSTVRILDSVSKHVTLRAYDNMTQARQDAEALLAQKRKAG